MSQPMDEIQQLFLLKQIYSEKGSYDKQSGMYVYLIPPSLSQQDLQALKIAGREPNQMVQFDHDALLPQLKQLASSWSLAEAADAFVASLWSAPFLWRSALPGVLLADKMPEHVNTPYSSSDQTCKICGARNGIRTRAVDRTLRWFDSMSFGTPLEGDIKGYILDFEQMAQAGQRPVASDYDRWVFQAILTVIRELPATARYSKAAEELNKAKLLPTNNKYVYISLLETLALIGVLDTPEHPGLISRFSSYIERDQRPSTRVETQAPLAWWNAGIGINESAMKVIFAKFDSSSVSLQNRPLANPPLEKTVLGALSKKRLPRAAVPKASSVAGKGSVESGDVYGVRIRDGVWVTVYCHEIKQVSNGTVYTRVEYLDGVFDHMPTVDELKLSYRGRRDGRNQQWASSMDSTSWVRRITRKVVAPISHQPLPDRVPNCSAANLKSLAEWCFPEL